MAQEEQGKTGVQMPKWLLYLIITAIPGIFTVLVSSYESRIGDKDKQIGKCDAHIDSLQMAYTTVLLRWNERSKELSDSYIRLIEIQRVENYKMADSLLSIIWILRQGQKDLRRGQAEIRQTIKNTQQ